ncbi:MAG: peptidoglycan DD-metalloendopeptidase family protein [Erythrobacter sp.]
MSAAATYLIALIVAGGLLAALALLIRICHPKLRHWPALWATGLIASAAVPVVGWLLPDFSDRFSALGTSPGLLQIYSGAPLMLAANSESAFASIGGDAALPLAAIGLTLYLCGAALLLLRLCAGRWRAVSIAARATPRISSCGASYWISDEVAAPIALASIGKAGSGRIIIPTSFLAALPDDALEMVIRHEREHLNRNDDLLGFALRVIVALTWISPFSHFLFARWSLCTEIQCDHAAVVGKSSKMRNAYAAMLLKALHIMAGRVRQYPAPTFSTQRLRNEKMRITQIMAGTPASFKHRLPRAFLTAAAIGIVGIGGASVASTAEADGETEVSNPVAVGQTAPVARSATVVDGIVTARFGTVPDPFRAGQTRQHKGVDIKAPTGTPVHAPANGTIVAATDIYDGKPAYGIVVLHRSQDGLLTLFAHLESFAVTPGQVVAKGERIAMVGNTGRSTGPHVHIETIRDGTHVDPLIAWPDLM